MIPAQVSFSMRFAFGVSENLHRRPNCPGSSHRNSSRKLLEKRFQRQGGFRLSFPLPFQLWFRDCVFGTSGVSRHAADRARLWCSPAHRSRRVRRQINLQRWPDWSGSTISHPSLFQILFDVQASALPGPRLSRIQSLRGMVRSRIRNRKSPPKG